MNNRLWLCLTQIGGSEMRDDELVYDPKSVTLLGSNVGGVETAFENI